LDALLLTQWENVYYMTGFMGALPWITKDSIFAVVVGKESDPVFILPEQRLQRSMADMSAWTKDVRGYRGAGEACNVIKKSLAELGINGGKVGAELGGMMRITMPAVAYLDLVKTSEHQFVNGGDVIWKLRMIKSQDEVDRIRRAARAASRGSERAFEEIKEGMSEREFAQLVGRYMIEEGADRPAWILCQSGEKFRTRAWAGFPSERKIRRGEYVQIDYGAVYRNYVCDLNRTAFFGGQPPPAEKDHYEIYVESNRKGTEALRPGVKCSDVFRIMAEPFEEAGLKVMNESLGHGIGLDSHEPPHFSLHDDTILEPSMVLAVEPTGSQLDVQGPVFNCEDNIAVTETGHDLLSTIPRELRIV